MLFICFFNVFCCFFLFFMFLTILNMFFMYYIWRYFVMFFIDFFNVFLCFFCGFFSGIWCYRVKARYGKVTYTNRMIYHGREIQIDSEYLIIESKSNANSDMLQSNTYGIWIRRNPIRIEYESVQWPWARMRIKYQSNTNHIEKSWLVWSSLLHINAF